MSIETLCPAFIEQDWTMNAALTRRGALGVILTAGIATAAFAATGRTLVMNGAVVSDDVIMVNGSAYVKLADLAKASHMAVIPRAGGYEIAAPGGANQVNAKLNGKIGDQLFDGSWRLKVLSAETLDTYNTKYSPDSAKIDPRGDNDTLLVITMQIANGMKENQSFGVWGTYGNAVSDDQGQSFQPIAYDMRSAPGLNGLASEELLPGASAKIAVVVSIPKGTTYKDFVIRMGGEKSPQARVSLTP